MGAGHGCCTCENYQLAEVTFFGKDAPGACGSAGLCSSSSEDFRQLVALVRHGERLDQADPITWMRSKDGQRYPFDAPLTGKGVRQAQEVARELAKYRSWFHLVVCSPYVRCVQTAAEIAKELELPLAVDNSLGEIYGPRTMGGTRDGGPPERRSPSEVFGVVGESASEVELVKCRSGGLFGQPPQWPESLEAARLRFISRTECFLSRSAKMRRNFILVSHGDAVAIVLQLLLRVREAAMPGEVVDFVDYCGYLCADRDLSNADADLLGSMVGPEALRRTLGPQPSPRQTQEPEMGLPPVLCSPGACLQLADESCGWRVAFGNVGTRLASSDRDVTPQQVPSIQVVKAAVRAARRREPPKRISTQDLEEQLNDLDESPPWPLEFLERLLDFSTRTNESPDGEELSPGVGTRPALSEPQAPFAAQHVEDFPRSRSRTDQA